MKLAIWPLAILLLLAQAACNTTRGLGQDIEAAGRTVSEVAQETKKKLED